MRPLSIREAPPRPGSTGGPSAGSVCLFCHWVCEKLTHCCICILQIRRRQLDQSFVS